MMKLGQWNKPFRIGAGAVCSLLIGWAAIAFGIWLTIIAFDYLAPSPSLFPPMEFVIGFGIPWLAAFPLVGFAMGLVCVFFWQSVVPLEQQKQWTIGLSLIFFLPVAILGLGAICVLAIEFPLVLFALNRAIESPVRWRHFFGLSNDWERDEDEIKSP